MARGDWIINNELGFAVSRQQRTSTKRDHRVSSSPRGACSGQLYEQHGAAAARDIPLFSGCENSAAAAAEAGQIHAEVQRQCHALYSDMDITLPLYWESMVRSCRSSLDALEFEFSRAQDQAADSPSSLLQHADAAAAPVSLCVSHADELFYKGQLLPLHLCPRTKMVKRLSHDEKRDDDDDSGGPGENSNSVQEAQQGLKNRGGGGAAAAAAATTTYNDFSPTVSLSSHLFQPRYSKFCMKSGPHDAPVETVLQDSRSSSFRSQSSSSGIAACWETSAGDKEEDSGASDDTSSTSPESSTITSFAQEDSICFNAGGNKNNHDHDQQQRPRASTEEEEEEPAAAPGNKFPFCNSPPTHHQAAGFLTKDFSSKTAADYETSDKKQAAAEIMSRRSAALSSLLRPWKALFGTKKSSSSSSKLLHTRSTSREAEHLDQSSSLGMFSRLSDATSTSSPIISWSAPLQRTAPLSPINNCSRSSLPYSCADHESAAAAPLASAPMATTAEADQQPDKDHTLRLLRRELSLHNVRNSSRLLPAPNASTSAKAAQQKMEPRLTHSQSAVMSSTTSASPRSWCRQQQHHEDSCATPKLPSREHWKKYVKMLNPLHTKTSHHMQESLCKIDNGRINPTSSPSPSSSGAATATATTTATTNTPVCTPSRKSYGSSSSLPTIKLHASSSESGTRTKAHVTAAATTTGSKISRIIASSVMTPRSKSVNPTSHNSAGMSLAATRGVTINQSTISEQHNAVQGAIAHCKQSNSGLLLCSTSS
ncbi:hypothetical protein BDL97_04G110400 [Sphagnum fallax]|nr:hypothetical protein BDL97_04G110400 [Sphagnum fallax]KAH8965291.1 hypothetical protein BDL97_04G110400 [Sphagnum fallax]